MLGSTGHPVLTMAFLSPMCTGDARTAALVPREVVCEGDLASTQYQAESFTLPVGLWVKVASQRHSLTSS